MSLGAAFSARDDLPAELLVQLGRFVHCLERRPRPRAHVDPSSIGPLLPNPKPPTPTEQIVAGVAVVATALAKYKPQTFEFLTKYGLGVGVNPLKGTIKPSPLVIANLLPQPIGFVPPEWGGLKKNWYLPDAVLKDMPGWFPGRDQARTDLQNKLDASKWLADQNNLDYWTQRIKTFDDAKLASALERTSNPDENFIFRNPQAVAEIIRREQKARAEATQAKLAANPSPPTPGATTVASPPQPIPQLGPQTPTPATQPTQPIAPPLPSGFVVITPGLGPNVPGTGPIITIDPNKLLPEINPRPREKLIPFIRPTPQGAEIDQLIVLLVQDP